MPTLHRRQNDSPRATAVVDGEAPRAWRIDVTGRVQGIGLRPAIARLASEIQLAGRVRNTSDGVTIEVAATLEELRRFQTRLADVQPAGATTAAPTPFSAELFAHDDFQIVESAGDGPLAARVPPDVAVCEACLADAASVGDRRYGYAFTSCTQCGPRYSVIAAMPYDRPRTTMATFHQCANCNAEYRDPVDRRFHSQTNCCPVCGPQTWLSDGAGAAEPVVRGAEAVEAAVQALLAGRIVALRGVGGYQLLVDATSEKAVCELRRRKRRHGKPLAVLVADVVVAESLATCDSAERNALASPANAIVIVSVRADAPLAASVTAGLDTVGLMLPATPLHDEVARRCRRPLVATSGNLEGEPLAFEPRKSERALAGVADLWLHHDRPIARPIDDSVVRVVAGQAAVTRLARGLAPWPLGVDAAVPMIALGGHQKAAIALCNGRQAVLGPHIGDLDSEAARTRYLQHVESMMALYAVTPQLLVHDEHPDYFTTRWASEQPIPTLAVQHHHAHVVAGMIEPRWLDREVLGVAWDGTGFGLDGTIWGGEFLRATANGYRRVARLRPFSLPGGERAIREPWRVAASLAGQALGLEAAAELTFDGVSRSQVASVAALARSERLCPQTSSAGRLFDGVAALALNATHAAFEGQPAMQLESACDTNARGAYEMPIAAGDPMELDWRPLVRGVLSDRACGAPAGTIAMRFHRALADAIVRVAELHESLPVVLGGGCFQNRALTELVAERLQPRRREIALPSAIPANDGGLAAGQLAIAAARLAGGWRPCV